MFCTKKIELIYYLITLFFVSSYSLLFGNDASSSDCLFYKTMNLNTKYYIYNPNYPEHSKIKAKCKWRASSPSGSRIILLCNFIQLKVENDCKHQRLKILGNGVNKPSYAHIFCGEGKFSIASEENKIDIEFTSSIAYGRFICTIEAIKHGLTTENSTEPMPMPFINETNGFQTISSEATTLAFDYSTSIQQNSQSSFIEPHESEVHVEHTSKIPILPLTQNQTNPVTFKPNFNQNNNKQCFCGYRNKARLINGIDTKINEYPMMAGLVTERKKLFCGATIISQRYVITAAHCAAKVSTVKTQVLVGEHDIISNHETNATVLYPISSIIIHEKYSNNFWENDIALIKTERNIIFSKEVMPVCLPFKYSQENFIDEKAIILGWGSTSTESVASTKLKKGIFKILPISFCETFLHIELGNRFICTYAKQKAPCKEDAGGPILYENDDDKIYLIGVVLNTNTTCDSSKPSYNIRLTQYLNWIVQNTQDATYCK